ncbi:unnamed protein product, partial [Staurois parvus]
MICVPPAAPPVSVHQCQLSVLIHATWQCQVRATSMPHISAHLSCLPVSPISATYQCNAVSAANQCHLSVPVSDAYQCQSVLP